MNTIFQQNNYDLIVMYQINEGNLLMKTQIKDAFNE